MICSWMNKDWMSGWVQKSCKDYHAHFTMFVYNFWPSRCNTRLENSSLQCNNRYNENKDTERKGIGALSFHKQNNYD